MQARKRRILFVDDDPAILTGLQHLLYKDRRRWELVFAASGEQALAELGKAHFDVVVSDMRMPGMDGAALLGRIKDAYPATVRIVLSGQADGEAIVRALPALHQLLSKPCDAETLRRALERSTALGELAASDSVKSAIGRLDKLPSPASLFDALSRALEPPAATPEEVAKIVARDPAMCAKVLQLVNSSYFGSGQATTSIETAVCCLGTERLRYILLTAEVFAPLAAHPDPGFSLERAQEEALRRALACEQRHGTTDAFAAGLLRDVGQLVLALGLGEHYRGIVDVAAERGESLADAERAMLGVSHREVGACLLEIWGIPRAVVEAVKWHHAPDSAPEPYRTLARSLHEEGASSSPYSASR